MKLLLVTVLCLVVSLEAKGFFSRRDDKENAIQEATNEVKAKFGKDKEADIRNCMSLDKGCDSVGCFYMIAADLTDDEEYHGMVVQWALGLRGMCWTDICEKCGWCDEEASKRSIKRHLSSSKRYNKDQALNEATGSIQENFGVDKEEAVKECLNKDGCDSVACFWMLASELTQDEEYLHMVGSWALKVNKMCLEDICDECGWCSDVKRSFPSSKKSTASKLVDLSRSARKRFLSKLN